MHPEAAEALVTECRRLVRGKSRGGVRGHTGWHKLGSRSLLRPSVQAWPESDAALHPEVGPVQHLLPQWDLLPRPVHPGNRATEVAAGTKVEPDRVEKVTFTNPWKWPSQIQRISREKYRPGATEEILGLADPVVVPDRQLQTPLHHLETSWSSSYFHNCQTSGILQ